MCKVMWLLALLTSSSCAAFSIQQSTTARLTSSRLFGDGNPPDFSNWGQPQASTPAPAPAPVVDYSSWGQPTAAATTAPVQAAPATVSPVAAAPPPVSMKAGGDPIAVLSSSQATSVAAIEAGIPDLVVKDTLSWSNEQVGGSLATLDAWDAPGASNVAWLGSVCIEGKLSSLTIFNGPLTDVPHILSRACMVDGQLQLAMDIRPRAYGAYELKNPTTGEYPGPEELGRKAFEYSGARNDFFEKFGTDEIKSLLDPSQFEGATDLVQSDLDLLTGGPLALHVSMPPTPANLAKVVAAREGIASAWLSWALQDGNQHRPGAPVNTQYVYDSKFRQNCYSALMPYYSTVFGPADGARLAAAESGPLDEAYVGGGS